MATASHVCATGATQAVGMFRDNIELLLAAAGYLKD